MKISRLLIVIMLAFCWGCNDSDSDGLITIPGPIYDANGGTSFLEQDRRMPVRDGYIFSHWNDKRDGSGECNLIGGSFNDPNAILYAQWTPLDRDFNVILESGIGDLPLIVLKNLQKGSVITLPDQQDYKNEHITKNYSIVGWVEGSAFLASYYDGTTLQGSESSVVYNDTYTVEKTIVLFAKWEKK